ncbi:MAG: energy transducer TonB [Brevinematales bacterium]|nr:energy transducer TonB [Brevinematales bacterium]
MKIRYWILLSLLIHIVGAIGFSMRITWKKKHYVDLSYLTIVDFQEEKPRPQPQPPVVAKKEGDITPSEKPVVEETNKIEDTPSLPPSKEFLPFYLVDDLPVPLVKISPEYPEEARRLGIEGAVVVKLYINERGEVEDIEIVKSPDKLLSQAALKSLQKARFSPARASGKPVPVILEFTLRFRLQ